VDSPARATRRPGVSLVAVVGVAVLLFGPVIAPFTTIALSNAATADGTPGQQFTAIDGSVISIERDAWSLSSSFFVASSAEVRAAQEYALLALQDKGFDESEFMCLVNLWNRESRWNYRAENRSSGAYGIPQALPGKKMASAGSDWQDNPETQIDWGIGYITNRYKSPCRAWQHSEDVGWY
jgi:hypothetical protein